MMTTPALHEVAILGPEDVETTVKTPTKIAIGTVIGKRPTVSPPMGRLLTGYSEPPPVAKLRVDNLHYDLTEDDLYVSGQPPLGRGSH